LQMLYQQYADDKEKLAQQRGKQTISGAEVIALQAVEQFTLYTGVRPDSALVAEASAFARS
ncbi:hypothetical protein Q8G81_35350, partial [Klebsiella pneumoniae]